MRHCKISAQQPAGFCLQAYDARCLDLRSRCDHVCDLADEGRWEELSRSLPLLARDIGRHFGQALARLESADEASPGDPLNALNDDLRANLRDLATPTAQPGEGGGPALLRLRAARCAGLFRRGHAAVLARLPEAQRRKLDGQKRRQRRSAWVALAAVLAIVALALASPSLERVWNEFQRNNFVHDFLAQSIRPASLDVSGAFGPEHDAKRRWRWGCGARTVITFHLDSPGPLRLDYAISNPLEGQELTVSANGRALSRHAGLPAVTDMAQSLRESLRFQGRAGRNEIVFEHPLVNRFTFVQDDTPYAVAFLELTLAAGLRAGQ